MGTLLFIILVVIVLAALLGAGGYSVRRYWSPAGTEVVETGGDVSGAGAGKPDGHIANAELRRRRFIGVASGFSKQVGLESVPRAGRSGPFSLAS
ncbi:MAG: hypothetical protein E6I69_02785 [Chloroflexi bacterium]|nr:MAG: hypothetical protein E6I69_02785 [Chloroflexota bacterium]